MSSSTTTTASISAKKRYAKGGKFTETVLSTDEVKGLVDEKREIQAQIAELSQRLSEVDTTLTGYRRTMLYRGMTAEEATESLGCAHCSKPLVGYRQTGDTSSTMVTAYECFHQTEIQKSRQPCWHLLCLDCAANPKFKQCPRCHAHIHGVETFKPTCEAVDKALSKHTLTCPYQSCTYTATHQHMLLHCAIEHCDMTQSVQVVPSRCGEVFSYYPASTAAGQQQQQQQTSVVIASVSLQQ